MSDCDNTALILGVLALMGFFSFLAYLSWSGSMGIPGVSLKDLERVSSRL